MKRLGSILAAALLAAALLAVPASAEDFGLKDLEVSFANADGSPATQAGSHPFAFTTKLAVKEEIDPRLGRIPAGQARELTIENPVGLVGSPIATERCAGVDFATLIQVESGLKLPNCSNSSVIGLVAVEAATSDGVRVEVGAPLYSLVPPPGIAARFGFVPIGAAPVTIDAGVRENPPYNLYAQLTNIPQTVRFFNSTATIWGNPSSPAHDKERGRCGAFFKEGFTVINPGGECPTTASNLPFITLPRECEGPLFSSFAATSWLGDTFSESVPTKDQVGEPVGISGCSQLGFGPRISAQPTSRSASAPSGLDFELDIADEGLTDPDGIAKSDIEKAVVTLPRGMTINPSQAEGLQVCSEAQLRRERPASQFGAGCPGASKIGTVEVESPLLEGTVFQGSLFVAEPYENRFGTLIALYMTVTEPKLGVIFKLAGRVEPDPRSGQLIATFDEIPRWPFSHFRLRFREGGRSPLITPPLCGTYTTVARFTPTANPANPLTTTSSFEIDSGVGGGPCPPGGTPPFEPGFTAGSLNNAAGHYSPFYLRLTRRDGDQDMTRFSAQLPPGVLGKLAGVGKCPEARIARARSRTGLVERANPSCPASSEIGEVLAGAGVGSQLTYVKGKAYLAGPFNGAPLSVLGVVPAVAGPFDVGTVVVRQALVIDPRTARVTADGSRSDPIPHILQGIPLSVRDIRVNVDRPEFTINPTGCDPSQVEAELWAGGADPFSTADDSPFDLADRFQAADCQSLAFKPRLSLRLKGATKRGGNPALRAVLRPRPGEANIEEAIARLPRSAFLDQSHIRTICTRVQFAADACPKGAVYGHVRAFSPLLDEPLAGPVYLRSSNHNLPDLVFDLHGLIDFEVVARIDSKRGGIRTSFTAVPDAPISKVILRMQGGRKGLIVNSTNLCAKTHRANVALSAHNGKRLTLRPALQARCGKGA